jgi:putative molybdopterin biosynthesis protein
VDAIRALNEGRCTLAGFHTLEHPAADLAGCTHLPPAAAAGRHKIIGFARRTQGLIVARAIRWACTPWPMWPAPAPAL